MDYNVSSGPFLSYEIEIGDGPGPEPDNICFSSLELVQKVNIPIICLDHLNTTAFNTNILTKYRK